MKTKISYLLGLLLVLMACTQNQVVTTLQISLDAITAGFPVIAAAANLPADVRANVTRYLSETNAALGAATTILDGDGSDASKAARIASEFAAIAKPEVPAQYQPIADLVSTVAKDVASFLASLPRASAGPTAAKVAPVTTKLSTLDHARLAKLRERAQTNQKVLGASKIP